MTEDDRLTLLLSRAKTGDRPAFDELVGPMRNRLVAFARSRLGPVLLGKLEPEDVVQDAFLKAFESCPSFRGTNASSLWSWLASISEHLIWNASRKRSVKESSLLLEGPSDAVSPSRGLRREERLARLEQSLSRLTPDQREVIVLAKIDGLRGKEIARRLGRSEASVRQAISRALKALRESFGDTESLRLPARELRGETGDAGE